MGCAIARYSPAAIAHLPRCTVRHYVTVTNWAGKADEWIDACRESRAHFGDELRRVSGLRREEVALLAGMSVDYYTRLEQGRERSPSPRVPMHCRCSVRGRRPNDPPRFPEDNECRFSWSPDVGVLHPL